MITGQSVALFIHLLGVVILFIAIGIMQRGGARLRASSTVDEMRLWLGLVQTTRRMFPAAFLFILGSGLYMTDQVWGFDTPWIVVAIVSIVIMGILGGAVVGRGFAAMGRAATETESVSADVARVVASPMPWVAATTSSGMAIGVLWLMAIKPGWTQSIVVVVMLGVVGGIVGFAKLRGGTGATEGPAT